MLRKIKPLEWRGDETLYCGEKFIGGVRYMKNLGVDTFYPYLWRHGESLPKKLSLAEAKAAVEQAFVKWLDTFSEEVGE